MLSIQEVEAADDRDYQEGEKKPDDKAQLFLKLKQQIIEDMRHSGEWRRETKDHYDMVAGRQWSEQEKRAFEAQGKVPIEFNRILSVIKSVAGHEINQRQELKFLPRGVEDTEANETLNAASEWMSDNCDAEDEESDAFQDTVICGMGWTEHLIEYASDPEGEYTEIRVDPLEMAWDRSSKRKNLADARRVHRIKRDIDISEARRMFPGYHDIALDAKWIINEDDGSEPVPIEERREHNSGMNNSDGIFKNTVTIVETQWYELSPYYLVASSSEPDPVELTVEQYRRFSKRALEMGIEFQAVKLNKRRYKRAFLGNSGILEMSDSPAGENFTYTCITGERDRNKRLWFGLVAVMSDPQKFANKWLTNTLHILNVTAKGGVLAEESAFVDPREAEDSWARPQEITFLADGALSGPRPKIQEKPVAQFPAGYFQLMDFAISSIRDTSGVNLELLGLVDRNQAGVLEAQRKQAGMTILATLFNNLRRFRKNVGRIRLHYIQNYLSDGRLIRLTGPAGARTVPLLKDKTLGKFDVIVDETATSTSQKEQTWAMIVSVLPIVRDMLSPEMFFALLKYSPLPSSLVQELEKMVTESKDKPNPQAEQQAQLVMKQLMAKIERDQAAAQKDMTASAKNQAETQETIADTQKTLAEIGKTQADIDKVNTEIQGMHQSQAQHGSIADPNVQKLLTMVQQGQQQPYV